MASSPLTRLLAAAGLPVPKQDSVRSAEQAVTVAERIGYPVVVKPLDGNHGRGVCLDLQDAEAVREAFPVAQEQSRRGWVIVESFVTGKDYRCLIIDGKMVAINYDRGTAQHLCNPGGRVVRVAIRVVEGGDDAA